MNQGSSRGWLLLVHQLPAKPAYLRVKIWRRLQSLGAVALKGSVYALPTTDSAQEDFEWVVREIVDGGGEALICEARFLDGLTDADVEALFTAGRNADYAALVDEVRRAADAARTDPAGAREAQALLPRFKKRLEQIAAIDFFGADEGRRAEEDVKRLEALLSTPDDPGASADAPQIDLSHRTWVTRTGVHIDRIACAWLIRRFVDPAPRFKFVPAKGYEPLPGELRFDMYDAEFTHEGGKCSFEVLLERAGLDDPGLRAIGEIVHDIDLKDGKYRREETAGVAHLVAGVAAAHEADETRIERGAAIFDDLLAFFRRP